MSSPGDVAAEREAAHQILRALPEEPAWAGKISIEVVRWDNPNSPTPMYANYPPQEAVSLGKPKPSECDLVALILWSRFGTPLAEPLKPDGTRFMSGTEWEFHDALAAKTPTLVYRRTEDPSVSLRDKEHDEKKRQLDLVDSFFDRFRGADGSLSAGYIAYENAAAFDRTFKGTIEGAIRQLLEKSERTQPWPEMVDRLRREVEAKDREIASLKRLVIRRSEPEPRGTLAGRGDRVFQPEPELTLSYVEDDRIAETERQPDVLAVAPVAPVTLIQPFASRDGTPESRTAWGVAAVGADTTPFTGAGITVAILDTGIDATHPAFAGVDVILRDFTGEGPGDTNGHGTHLAGTIFGRDVEGRRIGIAHGVRRALIAKVIGTNGGTTEGIVQALDWARSEGAHIVVLALNIDFASIQQRLQEEGLPASAALSRALDVYRANLQLFQALGSLIRASQGPILIAAAGNQGTHGTAVDIPASLDGFISVAAVAPGQYGLTAVPFSNTGATLAAPGTGVVSAHAGGGLQALSGTSMAAAHVAGVAALWAEKHALDGNVSSRRLEAAVVGSATTEPLQERTPRESVGAGVVRAPQS